MSQSTPCDERFQATCDEMVDLVMRHEWMPGHNFSPSTAHANHQYDAGCAVCRGDVARILDVALGQASEPCLRCGRCAGCHAPDGNCPVPNTSCLTGTCPQETSESVTYHEDDCPQAVTYLESLLEGANPDEGFYE